MVEAVPKSWWDTFYESLSPAQKRNTDRRLKVTKIEMAIIRRLPWLRWPLIRLATTFWTCLFDEGLVSTCKPRWGALTFTYLNDGIKPSLWHTLQEVLGGSKYSAIYPAGAPRNKYEADHYEEIHRDFFADRKEPATVGT